MTSIVDEAHFARSDVADDLDVVDGVDHFARLSIDEYELEHYSHRRRLGILRLVVRGRFRYSVNPRRNPRQK